MTLITLSVVLKQGWKYNPGGVILLQRITDSRCPWFSCPDHKKATTNTTMTNNN